MLSQPDTTQPNLIELGWFLQKTEPTRVVFSLNSLVEILIKNYCVCKMDKWGKVCEIFYHSSLIQNQKI